MCRSIRFFLLTVIVHVVLIYSVCSQINETTDDFPKENRFVNVPQANGSMSLDDLLEPIDEIILSLDVRTATTFYLVTRGNNLDGLQIISYEDNTSLKRSKFVVGKTTIFLSHGWRQSYKDMNELVVEFLGNDDVNVITIDWSPISFSGYASAKSKTSEIGTLVGDFVSWLTTFGVSYDDVHLVGFSLGANLMGSAGRQTGGRVRKITGLDPAGPLWYTDKRRLQPTDAQYVEAIHTDGLFFGYRFPCGDADIYFNGGGIQPACEPMIPISNFCSHKRSVTYYAISIRFPGHFVARKCSSYSEARSQMCDREPYVVGTSDLSKSQKGIYEVDTETAYPY